MCFYDLDIISKKYYLKHPSQKRCALISFSIYHATTDYCGYRGASQEAKKYRCIEEFRVQQSHRWMSVLHIVVGIPTH